MELLQGIGRREDRDALVRVQVEQVLIAGNDVSAGARLSME